MDKPTSAALEAGDQLVAELTGLPARTQAATMGRLQKVRYTHVAMIDLIIEHPEWSQNQLAEHFGYTPGWISNVLASDAFQERMAARREEIVDPELKATVEERFRALTIRSLAILMKKLDQSQVSDTVALRAAELGAKALGIGGNAPPPAPQGDRLARLAERLLLLQGNIRERLIQGEVISVKSEAV